MAALLRMTVYDTFLDRLECGYVVGNRIRPRVWDARLRMARGTRFFSVSVEPMGVSQHPRDMRPVHVLHSFV